MITHRRRLVSLGSLERGDRCDGVRSLRRHTMGLMGQRRTGFSAHTRALTTRPPATALSNIFPQPRTRRRSRTHAGRRAIGVEET